LTNSQQRYKKLNSFFSSGHSQYGSIKSYEFCAKVSDDELIDQEKIAN